MPVGSSLEEHELGSVTLGVRPSPPSVLAVTGTESRKVTGISHPCLRINICALLEHSAHRYVLVYLWWATTAQGRVLFAGVISSWNITKLLPLVSLLEPSTPVGTLLSFPDKAEAKWSKWVYCNANLRGASCLQGNSCSAGRMNSKAAGQGLAANKLWGWRVYWP